MDPSGLARWIRQCFVLAKVFAIVTCHSFADLVKGAASKTFKKNLLITQENEIYFTNTANIHQEYNSDRHNRLSAFRVGRFWGDYELARRHQQLVRLNELEQWRAGLHD